MIGLSDFWDFSPFSAEPVIRLTTNLMVAFIVGLPGAIHFWSGSTVFLFLTLSWKPSSLLHIMHPLMRWWSSCLWQKSDSDDYIYIYIFIRCQLSDWMSLEIFISSYIQYILRNVHIFHTISLWLDHFSFYRCPSGSLHRYWAVIKSLQHHLPLL